MFELPPAIASIVLKEIITIKQNFNVHYQSIPLNFRDEASLFLYHGIRHTSSFLDCLVPVILLQRNTYKKHLKNPRDRILERKIRKEKEKPWRDTFVTVDASYKGIKTESTLSLTRQKAITMFFR